MSIRGDAVMVWSFYEWPLFPYIQRVLPIPNKHHDHACWIHANERREDSRIFEILPETALPPKVATDGLRVSRLIHDLYDNDLRGGLWSAGFTGKYQYGFHASEKLPAVRAAFETDGYEVVTLIAWQAQMYGGFNLESEPARRESLGRRFTDGTLQRSPRLDAARAAAMRYVLDGGPMPRVPSAAFPRGWLEQSMEGCVERWQDLDERLLDVVCASCKNPLYLQWMKSRSERGTDRHALLREKLLARGMSMGWVLSATTRSLMHWTSAKIWVRSLSADLAEPIAWVEKLQPKASRRDTLIGLFSALATAGELPLAEGAIKRWFAANPKHPLMGTDLGPWINKYQ